MGRLKSDKSHRKNLCTSQASILHNASESPKAFNAALIILPLFLLFIISKLVTPLIERALDYVKHQGLRSCY